MRMCRRIFQHAGGTDANIFTLSAHSSKTITLTQASGVLFVMTRDTSKTGNNAGGMVILDYSEATATTVSYYGIWSLVDITTSANSYNFTITNITDYAVDMMLLE